MTTGATVEVSTTTQLKAAVQAQADEIVVTDSDLAEKVLRFKKISVLSIPILVALTAASFTPVGRVARFGLRFAAQGALAASTPALLAVAALAILGVTALFALWKDYVVEAEGSHSGSKSSTTAALKLRRRSVA